MLNSIWREDWTKAWGWFKLASGSLLSGLCLLNEFVSVPEMKAYLSAINPRMSVGIMILGAVTLVASQHKND